MPQVELLLLVFLHETVYGSDNVATFPLCPIITIIIIIIESQCRSKSNCRFCLPRSTISFLRFYHFSAPQIVLNIKWCGLPVQSLSSAVAVVIVGRYNNNKSTYYPICTHLIAITYIYQIRCWGFGMIGIAI